MAQKRKEAAHGPAQCMVTALTGGLLAFGICVACLAGAAALISGGRLGQEAMPRVCLFGCAAGSLIGGVYAAKTCRCRFLPVAVGASVIQAALWMLIGCLIYQGIRPEAAVSILLSSVLGGVLAGLLSGIKL